MDEKLDLSQIAKASDEALLTQFLTSRQGVASHQVQALLKQYGHNEIQTHKKTSAFIEFVKNFTNPLILILIVISIISYFIGEALDGTIVLLMVLLSVCLNFYQEHKASKAAEELKEKVAVLSTVRRDGQEKDIKGRQIVPGDLLVLNAGDLIPADARIIEAKDFFVNQSALTGESFPVEKQAGALATKTNDLTDYHNLVFAGTNAVTGKALAVVFRTGAHTEFGAIANDLAQAEEDNSFTIGIKQFSVFILRIVLIFVLLVFAANMLIKQDFFASLTFAIAVAVGLTPEFLPMIMTVTMAKGALAMLKKGVIVKKLTAIPTFGSMDILCTDKTGTLTQDKIELVKYIDVLGQMSEQVLEYAFVNSTFQSGISNPLDEAIKAFKHISLEKYTKIDEVPFDFNRKRMSVILQKKQRRLMVTKGAPESIFAVCNHLSLHGKTAPLTRTWKTKLLKQYHNLSKDGFRVLAIATKDPGNGREMYHKNDETKMTLIGFTAFLDPVKPNAKQAIEKLEAIGIEIKVITGDNELVAQKACEEAGVVIKGLMLGHDIDRLTDHELGLKAQKATIFARFSPAQKNRVITALKGRGHVVGYMGDGINDAPSLKNADIGISVSNAVDVAKETADFILTHKSLLELSDGVLEGRRIFGNTMKYVMMGLSSNFGNMFSVLGAVIFLPFLPMLPIQILLNNFIYDISQITIPTDHVDPEYLEKPKRWDLGFIRRFMFIFGPISSIFDFATFLVMYWLFKDNPSAFQTGWFMESLATQTLVIHLIRTRRIPFFKSRASLPLILTTIGCVIVAWSIPYLFFGQIFAFTPLPVKVLLLLGSIVVAYLISVEIGKKIFYHNPVSLKA